MGARFEDHSRLVLSRIHEAVAEASNAVAITYANMVVRSFKGASNITATNSQPSPPGSPPAVNTGELRRSFAWGKGGEPRNENGLNQAIGNGLKRIVGTRLVYAKIHEFGGIIRAKGKALLVPLNAEARRMQKRGNIRAQKLVYIKRRGKPPLLVKEIKRKRTSRFQLDPGFRIGATFILLPQVRIPARPFMRPAAAALPGPAIKAAKRALTLGLKKRGLI